MKPTLTDLPYLDLDYIKSVAGTLTWSVRFYFPEDDDEKIYDLITQLFYYEEERYTDKDGEERATTYELDLDTYWEVLYDFVKANWANIEPHIKIQK